MDGIGRDKPAETVAWEFDPDVGGGRAMSGQTLAEVLGTHRILSRNQAGKSGCRGCPWISSSRAGSEAAYEEHRDHAAAAVTAWLGERLAGARDGIARNILADDIAKGRAADEWQWADQGWLRDNADAALDVIRGELGVEVGS